MSLFESLKEGMAEVLFPRFCVSCREPGAWWCESCRTAVQYLDNTICPQCLSVGACDAGRATCEGILPFTSVSSFGYYHDPKLRSVITAVKFNGTTALLDDVKAFISSRQLQLPGVDAVIPMPLSQERLRERGFNQAELIAQAIATSITSIRSQVCQVGGMRPDGPLTCDILSRVSNRTPQSSLEHDMAARRANVVGAFACHGAVPPNVLLVDDVVTTGATAGEAASALLAAGAQQVHLLTLAIGA